MQLYLIRHGQSFNNALEDHSKRLRDPHLTDLGQEQARLVGEYLATASDMPLGDAPSGFPITHLYCSPMLRALQTTQPIYDNLGLAPQVWVDIHEIGGIFQENEEGRYIGYPGMTRDEILEQFPGYSLPDNVTDVGWWNPDDGLEHETAAQYRALRVAHALRDRAKSDEVIALVAHAGFLDRLLKALLNQLPDVPRVVFYAHYNTGITRCDFIRQDRMRLHYLNRVDHLTPDLRSW